MSKVTRKHRPSRSVFYTRAPRRLTGRDQAAFAAGVLAAQRARCLDEAAGAKDPEVFLTFARSAHKAMMNELQRLRFLRGGKWDVAY